MNFIFLMLVSFCGLTLAQDVAPETEATQACSPDMCKFLKAFGAVTEKLSIVEMRLKHAENLIAELERKDAIKVAFTAALGGPGPVGPYNRDTTLIFRTVKTNVGNAYNRFTGIFTAPVSGLYYFTFSCGAKGDQIVNLALIKNDQMVMKVYDYQSSDNADNGSNSAFLQLQQGDQVYMRLLANSHVWGNDYITTFSGALLYQR